MFLHMILNVETALWHTEGEQSCSNGVNQRVGWHLQDFSRHGLVAC